MNSTIFRVVTPCNWVEIHGHFRESSVDFYRTTRRHNPQNRTVLITQFSSMNSKEQGKKQSPTSIRTWCFPYDVSDSSYSMLTRLWGGRSENRGSDPGERGVLFSLRRRFRIGYGIYSAYCPEGKRGSFLGQNAKQLLPPSAEVSGRREE
jgi:hypothetical protein